MVGALGRGRESMETIAAETGGWYYDSRDLRQFQNLRDDLSSQYLLEYRSTNQKLDGKYRKIRVESTNKNFKLKHRPGYYAGK
jgi:VWFA-related protein